MSKRSERPTNDKIIAAFEDCYGIVTAVARRLKVDRRSIQRWLKADDELRAACGVAEEHAKDFVEGKLFTLIKSNNPKAIMYYLDRKARDRGYGRHLEVSQVKDPVQVYLPENNR